MIIIEKINEEDIKKVLEIEKICFGNNWVSTPFEKEINKEECIYLLAKKDNEIIAYGGAWLIIEELHITIMSVLPEYRKNKVGQILLLNLLNKGIKKGAKWSTLEVKEDNIAAQKLYEKFKFSVKGRRKKYYQQDQKDALIMWTDEINTEQYKSFLDKIE